MRHDRGEVGEPELKGAPSSPLSAISIIAHPSLGGDVVRDEGRTVADMERVDALLQVLVCLRHAIVLTQMLEPRAETEILNDASVLGGILENVPAMRPIASRCHVRRSTHASGPVIRRAPRW